MHKKASSEMDTNEMEVMEARFEGVGKRFTQLQWMMGLGYTFLAALMGVFNFF